MWWQIQYAAHEAGNNVTVFLVTHSTSVNENFDWEKATWAQGPKTLVTHNARMLWSAHSQHLQRQQQELGWKTEEAGQTYPPMWHTTGRSIFVHAKLNYMHRIRSNSQQFEQNTGQNKWVEGASGLRMQTYIPPNVIHDNKPTIKLHNKHSIELENLAMYPMCRVNTTHGHFRTHTLENSRCSMSQTDIESQKYVHAHKKSMQTCCYTFTILHLKNSQT